jgi:hypothetical protein
MEDILQKTTTNLNNVKQYVTRNAARELSSLSEPCYYPKTKRIYFELLNALKLTDREFKQFVLRNYKGTKAEKWVLWKDPLTNLLVYIMHLFLKNNDIRSFASTMVYYMIVQYSRLMNKQIRYCDADAFKYTLDTLTRTHLFFREKSIPNSLYYLANIMQTTYKDDIKDWNIERLILFIGAARHRISQSVKSFAENYYRSKKAGVSIKTQAEPTDDEDSPVYQIKVFERGTKAIESAAQKITSYRVTDRKALEDAKKYSKIKTSIATLIVNELSTPKYYDDIKVAMQLFLKDVTTVSMICGDDYRIHVKKLMAIKRTNAQLYFKAQINILLMKIFENIGFDKSYQKYTSQTQFIINSFLAYYVTSVLRNLIC